QLIAFSLSRAGRTPITPMIHSAHEAGALREAIPRFPQRTFGRDRRHMKTHKDLRFTEARKLGHPAQHRALPASSGALGEGRHRGWGSHRAVSKDAEGFVNVVEAVAGASRYKRYKIGGK